MSGKKGCSGRPQFIPTAEQRNTVKVMCALGIPHDKICLTIRNPSTRKNISRPTLERVFRTEIDTAQTELHAMIGNFIVRGILGQRQPNGEIIKSERERARLAMFFAKTRMGRGEPVVHAPVEQNKQPINAQDQQPSDDQKKQALEKQADAFIDEINRLFERMVANDGVTSLPKHERGDALLATDMANQAPP
jgi:hypothetical protein